MRRVKYDHYYYDFKKKENVTETGEGNFHQFGTNYEEFETGVGNYSSAIVERDDGTVINIPAENIQFLDKPDF